MNLRAIPIRFLLLVGIVGTLTACQQEPEVDSLEVVLSSSTSRVMQILQCSHFCLRNLTKSDESLSSGRIRLIGIVVGLGHAFFLIRAG